MTKEELNAALDAEIAAETMRADGWTVGGSTPPVLTTADVAVLANLATERLATLLAATSKLSGGRAEVGTWGKTVVIRYEGSSKEKQ